MSALWVNEHLREAFELIEAAHSEIPRTNESRDALWQLSCAMRSVEQADTAIGTLDGAVPWSPSSPEGRL